MTGRYPMDVTTSGPTDMVVRRKFDAPAALVFDAHTKPELVRRWLTGPEGWSMTTCEIDLRPGGCFRYVLRNTAGQDLGWGGEFHEIERPTRIVHTELFDEDWTDGETLSTVSFIESDGVTDMIVTVRYSTKTAREKAMATGMEGGMRDSYDRLEEVLEDLTTG